MQLTPSLVFSAGGHSDTREVAAVGTGPGPPPTVPGPLSQAFGSHELGCLRGQVGLGLAPLKRVAVTCFRMSTRVVYLDL